MQTPKHNAPLRFLLPMLLTLVLVMTGAYGLLKLLAGAKPLQNPQHEFHITLTPAPFDTPTPIPTATPDAPAARPILIPDGTMTVGAYVKVSGTNGLGLRIRNAAGTAGTLQFLAMDEEIFKLIAGPVSTDGYTWWQVEAPYDKSRNGWAAESFLQPLNLTAKPGG